MRKYLLGAAAALAIAAPGIASADSGEIGVSIGNIDFDSGDLDTYGIDGSYVNNLHGDWVVHFDGAQTRLEDSGFSIGVGHADASVGVRNEGHALYGFIGMGNLYYFSSTNFGIGGQLYFPQATVNGSVGFANIDDADLDVTNVSVDGTWFFTPNFGVGGNVGWVEFDGSGSDVDGNRYGISGVWRPDGTNFTFGAGYENIDFDDFDADSWRLSLTYNFGTGTEQERSQTGASFNGADRLFNDMSIGIF
jgi:hypothetical protein